MEAEDVSYYLTEINLKMIDLVIIRCVQNEHVMFRTLDSNWPGTCIVGQANYLGTYTVSRT